MVELLVSYIFINKFYYEMDYIGDRGIILIFFRLVFILGKLELFFKYSRIFKFDGRMSRIIVD